MARSRTVVPDLTVVVGYDSDDSSAGGTGSSSTGTFSLSLSAPFSDSLIFPPLPKVLNAATRFRKAEKETLRTLNAFLNQPTSSAPIGSGTLPPVLPREATLTESRKMCHWRLLQPGTIYPRLSSGRTNSTQKLSGTNTARSTPDLRTQRWEGEEWGDTRRNSERSSTRGVARHVHETGGNDRSFQPSHHTHGVGFGRVLVLEKLVDEGPLLLCASPAPRVGKCPREPTVRSSLTPSTSPPQPFRP